jgi:hypothetical protein
MPRPCASGVVPAIACPGGTRGVTASELTSGTGAEIGALSALGEPLHFAKRGIFAARERGVDSFTQR